jgi:hypothetical protein
LTLAEAKQLLSTLQQHLLQQQVATFLDTRSTCAACGALLHITPCGRTMALARRTPSSRRCILDTQ